ncbi:MAG: aspartate--tRNA(Asn) ligase [Eubacteriaceae bacterium]|nr:aspartate--tRNA(Asn) ligase [Eubacteriaceae bacterium]
MIKISEAKQYDGQVVELGGFVTQIRDLKKMQFVIMEDITGAIQLSVSKNEESALLNQTIASLTPQSSVRVTGRVHVDDFVKLGGVEIWPETIKVESLSESPLPIDLSEHIESNRDLRLDWRFLDLRRKDHQLIFKVETCIEMAMREFWVDNDFIEIHTPKIVGTPSEGGAELFELDFFGQSAYLAQSPQFYKQMAIAAGFEKVFEIGPAFRAENSNTTRHAAEFISIDCEMAWIDSHEDVMALQEKLLNYAIGKVKEKYGDEILEVFGKEIKVPTVPFPRVTMQEAKKIVADYGHVVPPETKGDLDPEAERLLGRYAMEKFGHEFIFVTEYPSAVRPFYQMRVEGDDSKTKSYDLIWDGIEVTTGAQREHRYDVLLKQAREKNVTLEILEDYLNCFRFGTPPHGGFGFGAARMMMNLLGIGNIREVSFIHRGVDRLMP